jgi:hypothetical protein
LFTLRQAVTPLRTRGRADRAVTLKVGAVNYRSQLRRPVALATADGRLSAVEIAIDLQEPLPPADANACVNVLFEFTRNGAVASEWDAAAATIAPPASLRFFYIDASGNRHEVEAQDGTGGFRRSGVLSLPWPTALIGGTAIRLSVLADGGRFSSPPLLRALATNVAIAEHRSHVRVAGMTPSPGDPMESARAALATQIANWLPHSGLELHLPRELGTPLTQTIRLTLRDRTGQSRVWEPVADLVFSAPDSAVFTADRERSRLSFGDGYAGRVPAPSSDFELTMQVGGGSQGNLGAGLEWIALDLSGAYVIVNVPAARGGSEPEDIEAARLRVAGELTRTQRAVTREDFVTLVETTPGVVQHRADVSAGHHPDFPCAYVADAVTVYVVPRIDREDVLSSATGEITVTAPVTDDGALAAIRTRLAQARLLTTQIFVLSPRYRAVDLLVTINGDPPDARLLQDSVRRALARHLDAVIGGNEHDGWPFGHPLRPSELVRVAQDVVGNAVLVQAVAVTIDGGGAPQSCQDVPIGPHDLVYLKTCRLEIRRDAARGGVL